jgi:flagellar basal body-associated protein FliL
MDENQEMANGRTNGSSSNTAIVAIVVIVLLAIVVFLFFFRPSGEQPVEEGPDIELEIEPPADGEGGGDSGDGG